MTDITTIGEVLIDLTQTGVNADGIGLFAANPGGAPANVAVAAARLGASTAFLGKIGRDSFGCTLRKTLSNHGVDVSGLLTARAPTTVAVVSVVEDGERSFSFLRGADSMLCPDEVDADRLEQTKFLHFGSVSLTAGPSRSATIFAARHAHNSGTLVSYDPNYRPALWRTQEDAQQWMTIPLPLVDVIKLTEEELDLVAGTGDPEEGSRLLEERGIRLIMVTLGKRGVFYRWQGKTGLVPGFKVPVTDTNGAGDTFLGAVLARLAGRGPKPLDGLEIRELEDILTFANRAAAWTCTGSGAIPSMPTLEQINSEQAQQEAAVL